MTDPSVIQTLLMPKYNNETGPNVRKWLSDSNVKYVHEAGPYEKISAKLLLNVNNVPSDETVFQCLIDCLTSANSMKEGLLFVIISIVVVLFYKLIQRKVTTKGYRRCHTFI